MRFFKNLSDIDINLSLFSGLGIGRIFQSFKYYLQLFVLANFSLLAMKDFVSRMYYFNCFSFFLGFLMSKYILAEELAQTAVTFANDLADIYTNRVSGMLNESVNKFKTSVKNVLEKKPLDPKKTEISEKQVVLKPETVEKDDVTNEESKSIDDKTVSETAEHIDQIQDLKE